MPIGPEVEVAHRERIAQSTQIRRPDGNGQQTAHEYTVRQVATDLGVCVDVVYDWIKHHNIEARRGLDGSWLVNFDAATTEAECRHRIETSSQIKIKASNKSKTSSR